MPHKLCAACMNRCKQAETVKIVRCPKFRKRLSENEFRDLLNDMDSVEARAAELSRRVKDMIARVTAGKAEKSVSRSDAEE